MTLTAYFVLTVMLTVGFVACLLFACFCISMMGQGQR